MLFDVDALSAEFSTIEIAFRGARYELGSSIDQILAAVEIARTVPDGAKPEEQFKILVPTLVALCPAMEPALCAEDLSSGEVLVLRRAATEALARISKVPFRAVGEGAGASNLGGEVSPLLPAVSAD